MMKKLLLMTSAIASLAAGAADAADLVSAPPPPRPAPVYGWTGCYVGAGLGYGMFNQNREVVSGFPNVVLGDNLLLVNGGPPDTTLFNNETFGGRGWLATAQFGCDYQFANSWVIGAFVDGDWSRIRGDQGLFGAYSGEAQLRSSWAVGGRIGWLVTPTLLAYVSGGVTEARFGEVDFVNNSTAAALLLDNFILVGSGAPGLQLGAQRYNGFFIGGGTEYAIDWWPGLFWKSEYRFADYRSATTSINCVNAALCGAIWVGPTGISERIHTYVQTVRTAVVWRFNQREIGKGPVRAAY
jgi:outer membrane immunogenic protein